MKAITTILILAISSTVALAQTGGGSSGGASGGSSASGTAGGSMSGGSMVNGTGGSPGPNTSNALRHGTTGNNLGTPGTNTNPANESSSGTSYNNPTANQAVQSLGNTDTGVLKK